MTLMLCGPSSAAGGAHVPPPALEVCRDRLLFPLLDTCESDFYAYTHNMSTMVMVSIFFKNPDTMARQPVSCSSSSVFRLSFARCEVSISFEPCDGNYSTTNAFLW